MFLKLMKYEMKACSRFGLWVLTAILLAGLVLGSSVSLLSSFQNDDKYLFLQMTAGLMSAMAYFVLIGSATVMVLLLLLRFYKTMVTDEAYLTLTLPVSTSSLLLSKLLTAMIWTLFSGLAIVAAIFIVLSMISQFVPNSFILSDVLQQLSEALTQTLPNVFAEAGLSYFFTLLLLLLIGLASAAESVFSVFMAILIGSCLARKHKLLASIGSILVLNLCKNLLFSVPSLLTIGALGASLDGQSTVLTYAVLLFYLAMFLGTLALEFIVSRWLIRKKVNLE